MAVCFQESEALTSQQNGQDLQTSSIASGKNSLVKSSSTTSPMQNNLETSKNSTRQLTLEELISSQEDFHVNHSASQENERDQKTTATCGQRCLELSESVNPVGSWARTFAGLLIGRTDWFSKRVALTWKLSGTPSNRLLFQLAPQALPTEGKEFGLLPTITTETGRKSDFKQGGKSMFTALKETGMLPTPTSVEIHNQERVAKVKGKQETLKSRENGLTIQNSILNALDFHGMLPTPTTSCQNAGTEKERSDGISRRSELNHLFSQENGKSSQLSPLFVEEMMGFPKNWTTSPFLNGEKNQSKHTATQ